MLENFNDIIERVYEHSQYYAPERLRIFREHVDLKKAMASADLSTPFGRFKDHSSKTALYQVSEATHQDLKLPYQFGSACFQNPSAAMEKSEETGSIYSSFNC